MKRRDFLTKAGVGAAAGIAGASALSTPSLAKSKKILMGVCTNKQERLAVDLLKKINLSK